MFIWCLNLIYELVKITTEIKLTCQAEVSELPQQLFEHKQETLVTQEMRKVIKLKTQTIRRQSCRLYFRSNICRLYGGMTKLGGYSIEIGQIDDEIEEKLNFWNCPKSTISLLASRYGMSNMRCFPIGGMKKQHDAILESFGTTEEIIFINSLAYRQQLTLFFPLLCSTLKILNLPLLLALLNLRNYSKSNSDLAAKRSSAKMF